MASLQARPSGRTQGSVPAAGRHSIGRGRDGDALLYLPRGAHAGRPLPLVLTLHGAGGQPSGALALFRPFADEHGLVLLAPGSRASTWDAVRAGFGPDVEAIDRLLKMVFAEVPVDPARVAVAGFSDGASYALGLGLANGRLFRRVIAFSPGFIPPASRVGRPAVFVSHGDSDEVLPVQATSRRIVPALRDEGYDVTYREFAGRHAVPRSIAEAAVEWLDES